MSETMAYDEKLAARVRKAVTKRKDVSEKKMFGGIAFMLGGKMCCGVLKRDLVVRVGADGYAQALAQPHARPMDFTGRAFKGFVYVGPRGYKTPKKMLQRWVDQAAEFVVSLSANNSTRANVCREPRNRMGKFHDRRFPDRNRAKRGVKQ
jgi:TfoX/Sxy family transcriptional regulator of competence genes